MDLTSNRRFIEDSFPIKEVGAASAKEKSIRHGHPSTLHIWWARRPLASSRTTSYAALIPTCASPNECTKKREFIVDFSTWENTTNKRMIELARAEILKANKGTPPKVLDPFAGGGSIPLETLRLGCETHSSDLNPVAVLIQKCTLEYPQRYGRSVESAEELGILSSSNNPLLEDVEKWALRILEKARGEIEQFYPNDSETVRPVGYIWARTLSCQNPSCGAVIPLMRQFWLARKKRKKVALFPFVRKGAIHFRIVGDGRNEMPKGFDPSSGTIARSVVTCLVCGSTIDANTTRRLFKEGPPEHRMIAVILKNTTKRGKTYRTVTDDDQHVYKSAQMHLEKERERLRVEWGIDPIPDEPLPPEQTLGFRVQRYGLMKWGDLFNDRQKLAMLVFTDEVRQAYESMLSSGYHEEYAKAITSYLALMLDRLADKNATLVFYHVYGEKIEHVFGRPALPMVWDYSEVNPFTSVGWPNMIKWITMNLDHLGSIHAGPARVFQASATSLPYTNDYFDAVFTDPPYYDNVPYSHLSDFFYVWLKRAVGHLYPELFSTPLTPKKSEIVAYSHGPGGLEGGKKIFEEMLKDSFCEMHRVLKPNGIAVIVYAHKSTAGWETLINSLLDSGLVVTSAWPINTELGTRLRARDSATLASSVYIVARKMPRQPTAIYKDVRQELRQHLTDKLGRLWSEGIGGADFFIAAIGSAIEVFGKYKEVIDYEGEVVRADRLLDDVRETATDYAIRQILHNGFSGGVSPLTKFYVLFRWNYRAARITFDEARKLAQSCGIDLTEYWSGTGFIRKEKEFIRVLGPHERKMEHLKGATEMIDIIHAILLLWEKNRRDEISEILTKSGFSQREAFWRVAQAISETLSIQDKEKKLLDGFLAGRNGYVDREQHEQVTVQGTPVKTNRKKKRRGLSPQMDREDEHEQVKLE